MYVAMISCDFRKLLLLLNRLRAVIRFESESVVAPRAHIVLKHTAKKAGIHGMLFLHHNSKVWPILIPMPNTMFSTPVHV